MDQEQRITIDKNTFYLNFDNIIEKKAHNYSKEKNFDFIHGLIGIGFYFIMRKKYNSINYVLDELKNNAINDSNGYRWMSYVYDENDNYKDVCEISLSHGSSAILVFLSRQSL